MPEATSDATRVHVISSESDQRVKLLLVDDHEVVRRGLRLLLEDQLGVEVVEASSAPEALQAARDPDIRMALVDLRLPGEDGLWVLQQILKERTDLPVVIISTFADEGDVHRSIEAGASGYLLKEATTYQLREAIATALHRRGLYLHPGVVDAVVTNRRDKIGLSLSQREIEVLRLLVLGATNQRIASTLHVTEKTVKSHMSNIFRKLGVSNRTQAAAKALREQIVEPGVSPVVVGQPDEGRSRERPHAGR